MDTAAETLAKLLPLPHPNLTTAYEFPVVSAVRECLLRPEFFWWENNALSCRLFIDMANRQAINAGWPTWRLTAVAWDGNTPVPMPRGANFDMIWEKFRDQLMQDAGAGEWRHYRNTMSHDWQRRLSLVDLDRIPPDKLDPYLPRIRKAHWLLPKDHLAEIRPADPSVWKSLRPDVAALLD